ncbi:MAG TPA: ABC transporter permease subunit, partial [Kofleriaceae bacterium]|nr:ABC transporter permease subunit [Kofleriaceae bacterium]
MSQPATTVRRPPVWGRAAGFVERAPWIDAFIMLVIAGLVFGIAGLAREWTGVLRPTVEIDLSPAALPAYTFYSLARGLVAFLLSLGFTLGYGYWAAKDRRASRVLIPLLDVLQSIPVLGFMPGLVLALVALFPRSNIGLELASIALIFTGQVWNMTFSFYHSVRSVPADLAEAATMFRFSRWERLRRVELPFATIGLIWNSMMSMAGGWFFLMISEAFVLGDKDFRLPGLGSYMTVAVARGDVGAMIWAIAAMAAMIIVLDQMLWRPIVVWAQKFRVDESGQAAEMRSWFLDLLVRSHLVAWARARRRPHARRRPAPPRRPRPSSHARAARVSTLVFAGLIAVLGLGAWKLVRLLEPTTISDWLDLIGAGTATLARVLIATVIGTLWTVPVGLAIGLSPRLSRIVQPVVQVVASFPAPMLFPALIALMHVSGIPLGWGSIMLMLVGTQWYILFNVIAGATAIPADLREVSSVFRMRRWERVRALYLPAVFPYLVTGWITAAGGAWNASIVAEHVSFRGATWSTYGLGAAVS